MFNVICLCTSVLIIIVKCEEEYPQFDHLPNFFNSEASSQETDVPSRRILHGYAEDITNHPHQVALVARKYNRQKIFCGGALVGPRVIFTAAHCTHSSDTRPRDNLYVLVGANSLRDPEGKYHKIEKIIKHPDFTFNSFDNDFSVILLRKAVSYSDRVQTIPVAHHGPQAGDIGTAAGWGVTELGRPAKHLRATHLTVERWEKCQDYFPKSFHPKITRSMICVRPDKRTTYYGDSGGPLVINGKLVGLVSFGRTVSGNKKTTVFTRVKDFLDFADAVVPPDF